MVELSLVVSGPTTGASEPGNQWSASPVLSFSIRAAVFLIPLVGAFLVVAAISDRLYRPLGILGLVTWFIQASIIGSVIAAALDKVARRLLPLATLFNMSLVFPDQAPSRFSVALRSGSVRKLQSKVDEGLGSDETEAAARALEFVAMLSDHDRFTRGHTERVRAYADLIAEELALGPEERAKLAWGVLLHDIGKITVPFEVLNKETQLTVEEWQTLANHPAAGDQLLEPLKDWLGESALATIEHHERWDGGGYPNGLAGEEISLAGRITAVADAYDVITSKRSYKAPMSVQAARRELVDCAGSQFDPAVVRAFLNVSLRRRWITGPLAVLSHLPVGQLGNAPAAISVGTVLAVGTVTVIPPSESVEILAFTAPTTVVVTAPDELTAPVPTITIAPPIDEPTLVTEPPVTEAAPASESPETSTVQAPVDEPTSTAPTTTAPQVATTAPATTSAAPTTAATTAVAPTTTTTTAPTTTTTAPTTTTTTPTTTTTTLPPGASYFLKNPGSGNTTARWFKTLDLAGPDDTSQPNFDTDRDSVQGLSLESTGAGFGETDLRRIQRFGLNASGQTLSGTSQLTLFVATDADLGGAPVTVRADISNCSTLYNPCSSPSIAEASATVSTWVNNGFQELTFDFGSVSESFGSSRRLVVRVITEDGHDLHVAFDADPYPSRVTLELN